MELEQAFREAIKYNAVALLPTLVGIAVSLLALWVGALGPFVRTVSESGLDAIIAGEAGFTIHGLVVFLGVGIGYVVHRLGRTTLLFKMYGDMLLAEIDAANVATELESVEQAGAPDED